MLPDTPLWEVLYNPSAVRGEVRNIKIGSSYDPNPTFSMSRVLSRCVPKLLSDSQKLERVRVCRELLRMCRKDKCFSDRLVTGDETWLHFYEPETTSQTSQWKRKHEATPIRPKAVASAGKRMATVFWDKKGIILIDWLPNKVTINRFTF